MFDEPAACKISDRVRRKRARRCGCVMVGREEEEERMWIRKRAVRGKKKEVATRGARALVVGLAREDSTAMRVEKVRTLSRSGPVALSAREAARGVMKVLVSCVVRESIAEGRSGFVVLAGGEE